MIIEGLIIILSISLIFIFAGTYTKTPPVSLAGFLFLFICGLTILLGGIEYSSGDTETYSYACGCCENFTFSTTPTLSGECIGTPHDCDYYDADPSGCTLAGCTYDVNASLCWGTPTPCENLSLFPSVCRFVGCEFQEGIINGCENGTEPVLMNKTIVHNYQSGSGEIVQGIDVNHVIGLFICLVAVFGFVLVFFNLEKFDVSKKQGGEL